MRETILNPKEVLDGTTQSPRIPDALLDQLLAGADPTAVDANGLLDDLKKALAERALNAEMDHNLASDEAGNSPSYFFSQLKQVAWLIPARRQISATGISSAPCFRMNAFCASENFESFIICRSSQPMGNDADTLTQSDPILWAQIKSAHPSANTDHSCPVS